MDDFLHHHIQFVGNPWLPWVDDGSALVTFTFAMLRIAMGFNILVQVLRIAKATLSSTQYDRSKLLT